ncbi:unnamed protein product [Closterium sp. Naga37s-1]|nr:unnamed protein product [Closterium sp. Naga37s-1]
MECGMAFVTSPFTLLLNTFRSSSYPCSRNLSSPTGLQVQRATPVPLPSDASDSDSDYEECDSNGNTAPNHCPDFLIPTPAPPSPFFLFPSQGCRSREQARCRSLQTPLMTVTMRTVTVAKGNPAAAAAAANLPAPFQLNQYRVSSLIPHHMPVEGYLEQALLAAGMMLPRRPSPPHPSNTHSIFPPPHSPPPSPAVEGYLEQALLAAGMMLPSNFGDLFKIGWSRSSRTDKGVPSQVHSVATVVSVKLERPESAFQRRQGQQQEEERARLVHSVATVVSVKLELPESLFQKGQGQQDEERAGLAVADAINAHLPASIRVFGAVPVTKSFSARRACVSRTYHYLLPADLLLPRSSRRGGLGGVGEEEGEEEEELRRRLKEFQQILNTFECSAVPRREGEEGVRRGTGCGGGRGEAREKKKREAPAFAFPVAPLPQGRHALLNYTVRRLYGEKEEEGEEGEEGALLTLSHLHLPSLSLLPRPGQARVSQLHCAAAVSREE